MKRNFFKTSVIAILATVASVGVVAVDLTGQTISARVIKALSISNSSQLNFGNFVPSSTAAGTISISNGTFTSNNVTLLSTVTKTPAQFSVSGEGGYSYTVTAPTTVSLTGPSGSTAMDFDTISIQGGSSRSLSGTAGTVGSDSFYMNGTLNVAQNQVPGSYSGTYTMTVSY
jgi:hypothetical protein